MKKYGAIIIAIVIVGFSLASYAYISNKDTATPAEKNSEVTDVGKLAARDLENDYPNTPRKVVDYYSKIMKCFYWEDLSDEMIATLALQTRKLFDLDLLNENPEEEFLENTKLAIKDYKDIGRVITDFIVEASSDIDLYTENDAEYAIVSVKYFLRDDKIGYSKTYEDYMLRKDEKGRWKIVGWQVTPANSKESDE